MSQEQLAEKMATSSQTISDWENNISCPEIQSLSELSDLFNISLDDLIGAESKELTIEEKEDCKKIKYYNKVLGIVLFLGLLVSFIVYKCWGNYYIISLGVTCITSIIFAIKVDKLTKKNGIKSTKELSAFYDGKRLDAISKQVKFEEAQRLKKTFYIAIGVFFLIFILIITYMMFYVIPAHNEKIYSNSHNVSDFSK